MIPYEVASKKEWLVANGLGGYASSTAVGANTRSYHGLLVAAMRPPVERMLLLSSLDESLGGEMLANHQYPGTIYPQGFRHLEKFVTDPLPHFFYRTENSLLDKTVFMVHGENTTAVQYHVSGFSGLISIVPLINCRSFHSASTPPKIEQEALKDGVRLKSSCDFCLFSNQGRYVRHDLTYYNMEYEEERQRGLPWKEDLFSPGRFEIEIDEEASFCIVATADRDSMPVADRLLKRELKRASSLKSSIEPPLDRLAIAADSFVVKRSAGKSIIAGYHWFDDWGRDTMISLPGLLLATGRFEDAKSVLLTFAGASKDGVLPNDLGSESYNTADASLWFICCVHRYYSYTGDIDFVRKVWPALKAIVARYSGQGDSIRMDSDGLVVTGPALTWMDARVDGRPVTPRAGKACEINALWFMGLKSMAFLAQEMGEDFDRGLGDKVKESYQKFWNPQARCLYDVIDPEDPSIRPNQMIAAAVPDLLTTDQRRSIVEVATDELLTPYGLRTLSPKDPKYIGDYHGDPRTRDGAYHQGTVWPWLLGPYITALVSSSKSQDEGKKKARDALHPLLDNLELYGMGTIPEVFSGDFPHQPGGTISQAWSVAEVIRAWSEDVAGNRRGMKKCL